MHSVSESWHLAETRKFLRKVFESAPDAPVSGIFPTYVSGNIPFFMPYIGQYSLEKSHPICIVAFYGEPQHKHVGAIQDEVEGTRQIYSIDQNFIEVGTVKLPSKNESETNRLIEQAVEELRQYPFSSRVQQKEADVFHMSRTTA